MKRSLTRTARSAIVDSFSTTVLLCEIMMLMKCLLGSTILSRISTKHINRIWSRMTQSSRSSEWLTVCENQWCMSSSVGSGSLNLMRTTLYWLIMKHGPWTSSPLSMIQMKMSMTIPIVDSKLKICHLCQSAMKAKSSSAWRLKLINCLRTIPPLLNRILPRWPRMMKGMGQSHWLRTIEMLCSCDLEKRKSFTIWLKPLT